MGARKPKAMRTPLLRTTLGRGETGRKMKRQTHTGTERLREIYTDKKTDRRYTDRQADGIQCEG